MASGRSLRFAAWNAVLVVVLLLSSLLGPLAPRASLVAQVAGTPTPTTDEDEPVTPPDAEPPTLPAQAPLAPPTQPDLATEDYTPPAPRPDGFEGPGPLGLALTATTASVSPGATFSTTVRVANLTSEGALATSGVTLILPKDILSIPTQNTSWQYNAASRTLSWQPGTLGAGAVAETVLWLRATGLAQGQAVPLTLQATSPQASTPVTQ